MRQAALVGLQREAEMLSAYGQLMQSRGVAGKATRAQAARLQADATLGLARIQLRLAARES